MAMPEGAFIPVAEGAWALPELKLACPSTRQAGLGAGG